MTIEEIDQLVRQANPVPDLSVLEPIETDDLLSSEERRHSMDTRVEVEKTEEPRQRRRGPMIALAAALTVMFAGVLTVLVDSVGGVADLSELTEVEKAQVFVDSLNEYDSETALSFLADDAVVNILPAKSPDDLPAHALWTEAVGFTFDRRECPIIEQRAYDVLVVCELIVENAWSDVLEVDPIRSWAMRLGFNDGDIVYAAMSAPLERFSPEAWEPFGAWVVDNHPDDVSIMYDRSSEFGVEYPYLTEESIELWRQHTEEFVAEHGG